MFLAATGTELIVVISLFAVAAILMTWAIVSYTRNVKKIENTQDKLSDKQLLLLFEEEPDGYLSKQRMLAKTNLTKSEVSFRLSYLGFLGLTKTLYTSSFKTLHRLADPIEKREIPELSKKPYLTVEDILKLFKVYDYKLTLQNLCLATGLPLSILKREMKFFEKEKIVEVLTEYSADGMSGKKNWVLREPYRSNPDQFLALEEKMNLELEKIYLYKADKKDSID